MNLIWREGCAHFLKLNSLQGAAGLMAAGCFTKGFYFVMFCFIQAMCFRERCKNTAKVLFADISQN